MAGWLGAVLLVLLRVIQGLSLAGEWGGAVLIATEHGGRKRHAFYAAIPQLGSPIGSILTAFVFLTLPFILSTEDFLTWGWRIPFLLAFPLLLVSLYLRWSIDESPVFKEVVAEKKRERVPADRHVPRPPDRLPARHRRRPARHRLVLADEHVHAQLRRGGARLLVQRPAVRDHDRRAAAARDDPAVRRLGEPDRVGATSSRSARSAP